MDVGGKGGGLTAVGVEQGQGGNGGAAAGL